MALVKVESMKVSEHPRTWVLMGLLIIVDFMMAFFSKWMEYVSGVSSGDVWEFVMISTRLLFLVKMATVVIAGDIVSSEFNWGTMKLLLIRPVNRTKILLSKYVTALLFSVIYMVVLMVSSLLFGGIFFGVSPQIHEWSNLFFIYILYVVEITMTATLAFTLSTVFRSSTLAIGLSIFLMFAGEICVEVCKLMGLEGGKYLLFANTDLSPYFNGGIPVFSGMTLMFSVGILLVHFTVFHLVSWLSFTKRDVSV